MANEAISTNEKADSLIPGKKRSCFEVRMGMCVIVGKVFNRTG